MNTKFLDNFMRVVIALAFALGMVRAPTAVVQAEGGNPVFGVRWPHFQIIEGWGWTLGATVIIEVYSPPYAPLPVYTGSATVEPFWWDPNNTNFQHRIEGYYPKVGDRVVVSDGVTTKEHIIKLIAITGIDPVGDLVYGIADPGERVTVWTYNNSPMFTRYAYADANGNWVVNYSIPGEQDDEQDIVDIRYGQANEAWVNDEDGDGTNVAFGFNHRFSVQMWSHEVNGESWIIGTSVTLTIDDPATYQSPDYTKTQTVNPDDGSVQFRLWEDGLTVQPGMFVTMTDGITTKTHTVTDLVVLDVDTETDTVWGTGTPGTWVEVGPLCDNEGCAIRRTIIAADGTWRVDFSVPGGTEPDEQKTYDLQECEGSEARQHDEDGDSTQYGWGTYCPPMTFIEQYTFNFTNPLLADLTIRRAIAMGADRQRILDEAFLPGEIYGQLVNSPIPPGNPYLAPASELTLYPYNPDEARTLLTNAGWVDTDEDGIREKDGQELAFTFKTTINPLRTIAAQIFRENMESIGIRITVIQETPGMLFDDEDGTLVRGDFDIAEFAWGVSLEDGDILNIYRSDYEWPDGFERNFGTYNNPAYNAALEAFENAATENERMAAIYEAQRIFTADLPAFYLFTRENIIPYQTPAGTSVTLTPLPQVTITYTNVNQEGITAALAVSLNPADLPQNMQLVDSPYEIGTTAMFEEVKVCLAYRDHWLTPAQEAALRLYHYHNGTWLDVTDPGYPDTVNNIVCGTATDFSLFAILLPTDATPPVITPVITGTQGSNGWYTSAVTVAWQVSDGESEVTSMNGCGTVTLTADTAGASLTCSAENSAGLSSTETVTVKIDQTPPVITWLGSINNGDSFYYGFVPPEPTCTAVDPTSGLAGSCAVSGYQVAPGTHTLFARVADNAGNQAVQSRQYTVLGWTLKGFYQPVDMNSIYNLVKGGSTVPLKFEIFAGSTELTDTAHVKSLSYAETSCNVNAITDEIELTVTGGTSLRYDTQSGQFIYNWKTPSTANKCYRVTMITQDGSSLLAYFKLK